MAYSENGILYDSEMNDPLPWDGFYNVEQKREFLPYATTWMNLEDIMLSKIRQIQKDKYCMVSLIHGILKKKKIKETK